MKFAGLRRFLLKKPRPATFNGSEGASTEDALFSVCRRHIPIVARFLINRANSLIRV